MKMTENEMPLRVLALAILCAVVFLTFPAGVDAGAKPVPIEGMSYDVNASLKDNFALLSLSSLMACSAASRLPSICFST